MKFQRGLSFWLLVLAFVAKCLMANATENTDVRGIVYPDTMGAKGDGKHDDTSIIQSAIDMLANNGGGTVRLGSGTYLVTSLKIGPKVSFVGNGNGATVIKQRSGEKQNCLVIRDIAGALKITDMTILGEYSNCGVYFEESGGFGENHNYLYTNTSNWNLSQAYKWITIENICVYNFDVGLKIEKWGFNINICNSTFSHNGDGVVLSCTDSSLYNCYVTNNIRNGIVIGGGNNKVNNVKSIFNSISDAKEYSAIAVRGLRCQIENCETQDNYGCGFVIEGQYNTIANCISNTDGYSREPKRYNPSVMACGFYIKGKFNTFSNCVVTNYNEKYGAVYYSPIIVDKTVDDYYLDIYGDIKVLIAPDKLFFNEPFKNVQTLSSKNRIEKPFVEAKKGGNYFVTNDKSNIIKDIDFHLSSLNLLIDFLSYGDAGHLINLIGDKTMSLSVEKSKIVLLWQGKKEVELVLDDDVVMDKDDMRLMVSFYQYQDKRYVRMLMFEKTAKRGWVKKETKKDTNIPVGWIRKATVRIGDNQVPIKRLAITQFPMPESVFLPSSNTNRIYDSAVVYIDADTAL